MLNLKINQDVYEANLTESYSNKDLLHMKMGHSSKYPPSEECDICLEEKQPFKLLPQDRTAKNTHECVSSDACGSLNPVSHNGDILLTNILILVYLFQGE